MARQDRFGNSCLRRLALKFDSWSFLRSRAGGGVVPLDDMRQLMGEQRAAVCGVWPIAASRKRDVMANGECGGAARGSGLGSGLIGMNTHLTEVSPKPSFHQSASVAVEWSVVLFSFRRIEGEGAGWGWCR